METHRFLKDYFITPLIIFVILFTALHWFDNNNKIEDSLQFGLTFGGGLSIFVALSIYFGNKFIRPKLNKKFSNHERLNELINCGFKLKKENNVYCGQVKGFSTQLYYGYDEMDVLTSRYYILVLFEPISQEKHKTLKPHRLFDHTYIGKDHLLGYYEFKLFPPKTKDLLEDTNAFCAYLRNHDIKPLEIETPASL